MARQPDQAQVDTAIFLLDRCLGRSEVAEALRAAGASVELLDDHFDQKAEDIIWLEHAGARGWAVLTKDKRIQRRENERRRLEESNVAAFVLTGKDMSGHEMGKAFATALPRMLRVLRQYRRPLIASVSRLGTVTIKLGARRGGPSPRNR